MSSDTPDGPALAVEDTLPPLPSPEPAGMAMLPPDLEADEPHSMLTPLLVPTLGSPVLKGMSPDTPDVSCVACEDRIHSRNGDGPAQGSPLLVQPSPDARARLPPPSRSANCADSPQKNDNNDVLFIRDPPIPRTLQRNRPRDRNTSSSACTSIVAKSQSTRFPHRTPRRWPRCHQTRRQTTTPKAHIAAGAHADGSSARR